MISNKKRGASFVSVSQRKYLTGFWQPTSWSNTTGDFTSTGSPKGDKVLSVPVVVQQEP
jgi:hypothetical protein